MLYRTTFKTPIGMPSYRVVCGKPCHLFVEIEHKAWWVIKMLNFDFTKAGEVRKPQLSELEEIRAKTYESARSYK